MSEKRDVEWCPEPWRTSGDVVLSADGGCVVESPWTCCEDDLRRIVACVNACAGIPIEALESGALGDLIEHSVSAAAQEAEWAGDDWCEVTIPRERWDGVQAALRRLGRLP